MTCTCTAECPTRLCVSCSTTPHLDVWLQGAFRQVAAEAGRMAQELTEILKKRMTAQQDEAAECIQMVRKLGEPIESLQVRT